MYSAPFIASRASCSRVDSRALVVMSAAFFVFWYPLALSSGIFTLAVAALALAVLTLIFGTCACGKSSAFQRMWRGIMIITMVYFAYISVGATPFG